MWVINDHADRTSRKIMYAFNLTGEIDEMRRRHDLVVELGDTCVMASLNSVGLSGFIALACHATLPIHAHRNGWGALSRMQGPEQHYALCTLMAARPGGRVSLRHRSLLP
jgi:ribulose-bisphosphate carboxylase large chain